MKLFSDWASEFDEAIRLPKRIVPHRKQMQLPLKKQTPVAHADIDRWLKSVDGLAKDLKDLQAAKTKAKDKMSQIGQKFKPDSDKSNKDDEKDVKKDVEKEKDNDTGIERKTVKRPRPDANREVRLGKPKPDEQPERSAKPEIQRSKPNIKTDVEENEE